MNEQLFTIKWLYNVLALNNKDKHSDILGNTLFNSKINLTPHQIDAALFALKSPLDKGVLLADEVGLGKTIEAGIIIAQNWFEKKSKILIIVPASLLRQWQNELFDKFFLNSIIFERKVFDEFIKKGYKNPFLGTKDIIICSYNFASTNREFIKDARFNLVVIDEAHKLRNIHNDMIAFFWR